MSIFQFLSTELIKGFFIIIKLPRTLKYVKKIDFSNKKKCIKKTFIVCILTAIFQ